jgi:hypothetical protein
MTGGLVVILAGWRLFSAVEVECMDKKEKRWTCSFPTTATWPIPQSAGQPPYTVKILKSEVNYVYIDVKLTCF